MALFKINHMKTTISYLFAILLVIGLSACNKDKEDVMEDDQMEMETPLSLLSPCKYDITFGTETFSEDGEDGDPFCGVTVGASGNADYKFELSPGGKLTDFDTEEGLSISKSFLIVDNFGETPPDSEFEQFFSPGTYPIVPDNEQGVQINYKDATGVNWSSYTGLAEQPGSTFEITEMVSGEVQGSYFVVTRGTFSCKLYNDAGDVKDCSGTFTLQFKNFS